MATCCRPAPLVAHDRHVVLPRREATQAQVVPQSRRVDARLQEATVEPARAGVASKRDGRSQSSHHMCCAEKSCIRWRM